MLQAAAKGKPAPKGTVDPADFQKQPEIAPSNMTNEKLRSYLDAQSRAMGIKKVVPPGRSGPVTVKRADAPKEKGPSIWDGISQQPMNREQARAAMQKMTRNLYQINQTSNWKRAPTVPIDGRTPKLIAEKSEASGLISAESQAAVPEEALGARSIGYTGMNARKKLKGKKTKSTILVRKPAGGKTATLSAMRVVRAAGGSSPSIAKQAVAKRAVTAGRRIARSRSEVKKSTAAPRKGVPRSLDWTRDWKKSVGGMPQAGGAVIKNLTDWSDMHQRVPFESSLPTVDFKAEMAVAVYGEPSMEQSRIVTIVGVTEEDSRLIVRYRIGVNTDNEAPKPSSPYHIVVVPRSDLPFSFLQVP
jgi:hypothetical protein